MSTLLTKIMVAMSAVGDNANTVATTLVLLAIVSASIYAFVTSTK